MGFYQFNAKQQISANLEDVWSFISSPANLKKITPDYMGFDILTEGLPDKMHPGMIIEYRVSPLLGIKTRWVTEITHVADGKYFVDEQRIGPYRIWHHQHHIEKNDRGVLMKDIVSYQPPMGFIGSLANSFFIEKKLREIFSYRKTAIEKVFG